MPWTLERMDFRSATIRRTIRSPHGYVLLLLNEQRCHIDQESGMLVGSTIAIDSLSVHYVAWLIDGEALPLALRQDSEVARYAGI